VLWLTAAAPAAAATKVGAESTSNKLPLQLGLIANQSGLQGAVKSASNPSSSS